MSFRGSSKGHFNHHNQNPYGWGPQYTDCSRGQFNYHARVPQPYQPTIPSPSVAPFQRPKYSVYCEICGITMNSPKCVELHEKGRKHQSMLRVKVSNTQDSRQRSNCDVINVSCQATISKHKNFQQKDLEVSSKIPDQGPEGKPKGKTSGNGCGFKRKIGGDRVGKYMKMNNGIKRPMESSKPDVSALSNSAKSLAQNPALTLPPGPASPIMTSTIVGGSISVEPHAPAVSNINNQTLNANSDSAAIGIAGPMASQVFIPPQAMGSSFGLQIESQNPTDETDIQLLPSVSMEFGAPSGVSTNTQTADGSSKAEANVDLLATELTQLSQVTVCLKCGDEGFSETFVFCNKCEGYALHRYCLDGPVIFYDDVTWLCEDCEEQEVGESSHHQCILLPCITSDSENSAKDASQSTIEPTSCIESVKDNNQQQQDIAAKTKVLLSDYRSLSRHDLSQSINDCEEGEENFKDDCESVINVESNYGEEFVSVPVIGPIFDPFWRGSWCFSTQSSDTVTGIWAHLSTLACPKVQEEACFFPEVLSASLLQRCEVWPKSFMKSGPKDESIALYFFPENESERAFDNLVDDMISHDLAIRAVVKDAELLVFASTVLPIQHRRIQAKYYLWGVFRGKKPVCSSGCSAEYSCVSSQNL